MAASQKITKAQMKIIWTTDADSAAAALAGERWSGAEQGLWGPKGPVYDIRKNEDGIYVLRVDGEFRIADDDLAAVMRAAQEIHYDSYGANAQGEFDQ